MATVSRSQSARRSANAAAAIASLVTRLGTGRGALPSCTRRTPITGQFSMAAVIAATQAEITQDLGLGVYGSGDCQRVRRGAPPFDGSGVTHKAHGAVRARVPCPRRDEDVD